MDQAATDQPTGERRRRLLERAFGRVFSRMKESEAKQDTVDAIVTLGLPREAVPFVARYAASAATDVVDMLEREREARERERIVAWLIVVSFVLGAEWQKVEAEVAT